MPILGRTGIEVAPLGLSASYRPGPVTVRRALDEGLNFFFCYGFDGQVIRALRDVSRSRWVVATGVYNLIWGHPDIRRTCEKRLRQLHTDHLDLFLFLGVMKEREFPERAREEMRRLCEEGKVRAIGMSCHDRKFAGRLCASGAIDVAMVRYNAAHRGAEQDIFPFKNGAGIVSYTATRWTALLRRPKGWPAEGRVPTAGECYRFVASNPSVDVVLTAPSGLRQFESNLAAVRRGPLHPEDREWMCRFGDTVHAQQKWFL